MDQRRWFARMQETRAASAGGGKTAMCTSLAEPSPSNTPAGVPLDAPVPRPGDRRHDIEPVRPPVVARPVTPQPPGVLHLDPNAVLTDLGAQDERAAVPGGAVQDRVGGELRGDQDRLVGPRTAAQPPGQRGPRDPDLPGFGRVGSGMTADARRRGCRGHGALLLALSL